MVEPRTSTQAGGKTRSPSRRPLLLHVPLGRRVNPMPAGDRLQDRRRERRDARPPPRASGRPVLPVPRARSGGRRGAGVPWRSPVTPRPGPWLRSSPSRPPPSAAHNLSFTRRTSRWQGEGQRGAAGAAARVWGRRRRRRTLSDARPKPR